MSQETDDLATQTVETMMSKDLFSRWLGVEVIESREGYSKIKMIVRSEMINGLGVVHGGITFSIADSAFAFACNSRNNLTLALDTSINFIKAVRVGDVLQAEAKEMHNGRSTGLYHVTVVNQNNETVGLFKGTCFRTGKSVI